MILSTFSFNDIFKSSFLESASAELTPLSVMLTMVLTLVTAIFIFMVYKRTFCGVLYSRTFNISLMMLAMVTAFIIKAVTSNIILSLGMVGALSIVRFRTAVKDPMDTVFMFWAISVGIINGAGLYFLGIFGSLCIGLMIFILSMIVNGDDAYLLVIHCTNEESEQHIWHHVKQYSKKSNLKSKTISRNNIELTIELRLKKYTSNIVNKVLDISGVNDAVLISYNGDYTA